MTCLWQIHQYWDEGLKVVYESFAGFSLSFLFWKKLQNQISCIKSSWGGKEKEKKVEMVSHFKIVSKTFFLISVHVSISSTKPDYISYISISSILNTN